MTLLNLTEFKTELTFLRNETKNSTIFHINSIFHLYYSGVDKVFGSCGEDGIRIWSDIDQQVLHIPGPPHAQTNCILFSKDGKSILSGWSDGCLRSHTPQSGKLMYSIQVRKK